MLEQRRVQRRQQIGLTLMILVSFLLLLFLGIALAIQENQALPTGTFLEIRTHRVSADIRCDIPPPMRSNPTHEDCPAGHATWVLRFDEQPKEPGTGVTLIEIPVRER